MLDVDIGFTVNAMPLCDVQKKYYLIHSASDSDSDDSLHEPDSYCHIVLPWILSTSLLAITSIYFASKHYNSANLSKHGAFATDLAALHPYVTYEERVFDGAFKYEPETGLVYRDFKNESEGQYFRERTDLTAVIFIGGND